MDKIKRILPIREYQLKTPLFVVFNINLNHYNAYGTQHYDRLYRALTNTRGANLAKDSVHLVPNITNLDTSIEVRGKSMSRYIERRLEKLN